MTVATETEQEFLSAARQALRTDAHAAPAALGWYDLLSQLDDPVARTAAFALFRAQGRELASTHALGVLLARPYLDATADPPDALVTCAVQHPGGRAGRAIVVGGTGAGGLLVDVPGRGVARLDPGRATLHALELPGRLALHEVEMVADTGADRVPVDDASLRHARARSRWLGRVALAAEILGACERAVDVAVEYAKDRKQFGEPIGRFQAVRHLLAWARTECVALEHVTRLGVSFGFDAPPHFDTVAKALAGRNGRRACQHTLQVLGAIGFTAEHEHHHVYGRVLLLDALLGTSAELTHSLGAWLRDHGGDPGFTRAALRSSLVAP